MSRRKLPQVEAPATRAEAAIVAGAYAAMLADVSAIEAERKVRRAQVDADCDQRIAMRAPELATMFAALHAWWAVERGNSKFRSTEIGAVELGTRRTPPRLKTKGKIAALIAKLRADGFDGLLRTKYELDKPAILKLLADPESPALAEISGMGFVREQRDEFFVEPLADRAEAAGGAA